MESMELLRATLALIFVIGLIGAAAWMARRFAPGVLFSGKAKGERRLGVVESFSIDARHRLVLVRRDDKNHLLLIGPGQCQLIESSIVEPGASA